MTCSLISPSPAIRWPWCSGPQGLSAAQLGALAREFNLSETVFVLPPSAPDATYRVRIFTPGRELPFAGHPSVGAAVTLLRLGRFGPGTVIQECGAGLLPISVTEDGIGVLTGGVPTIGAEMDPAPLLAAVGLALDDHIGPGPRVASCGLAFPFLRVTPEAVPRARLVAGVDLEHLNVFAWDAATATATTRVFAPGAGVGEDPATGSAALAFGVWLVNAGLLSGEGTSAYTVYQGAELLRPSVLRGTVTAARGGTVATTVAGRVIPVAAGQIVIPPDRG